MRIAVVAYVMVLIAVFTYLIGATLGSPVVQVLDDVAVTTQLPEVLNDDAETTPLADEAAVTFDSVTQRARQDDEEDDDDDETTDAPVAPVVTTSAPVPPPNRNESTVLKEFLYVAQPVQQAAVVQPVAPIVPVDEEEEGVRPTEASQPKSAAEQETEDQDSDNEITQDEAGTTSKTTFEAEYQYTINNFNKPKNRDEDGRSSIEEIVRQDGISETSTTSPATNASTFAVQNDATDEVWEYSQHLYDGEGRAGCECGKVPFKVVDTDAGINPSPWLAAVVRGGLFAGGRPHCGGTLINDLYVLTSASCMDGLSASSVQVWLTAHDTFEFHEATFGNIKENVQDVIMHPNYDGQSKENDLALLKLSKPVDISSKTYFVPACLPAGSYNFAGTMARVSGWSDNRVYKVCKADMPILDNNVCNRDTKHTGKVTENMVCAGYLTPEKVEKCTGDAGGPLIVPNSGRSTLVGVVSWGYEAQGRDYKPTVYTRVSEFADWILHNTRDADWCGV